MGFEDARGGWRGFMRLGEDGEGVGRASRSAVEGDGGSDSGRDEVSEGGGSDASGKESRRRRKLRGETTAVRRNEL
jgi:hypothetical protein